MKLRRKHRELSFQLQDAIKDAERAAHRALNLAYSHDTPLSVRLQLGKSQNLLMRNVVKYCAAGRDQQARKRY